MATRAVRGEATPAPKWAYAANIRRQSSSEEQPVRNPHLHQVLAANLRIGSADMYVLFDSGSTTNGISHEAAHVANLDIFQLKEPMTLQLGCVGSRSRVNFGTRSAVTIGGRALPCFLDIVNIEHYDVILGTPFLKEYRAVLDFEHNVVRVGAVEIPALTVAEEHAVLKRRGRTSTNRAPAQLNALVTRSE
ncbi:hypothetical protein FA95DRAFT_1503196 [Auriscalpium vulgare]|uniref:Uncharacterized protein n=1 Tax=Auriscalpium vulgare TaxID=40419 RepID=A0ACB8R8D0_9AGAM|nr:hypothetical protein FA95DRAFT_1503196 [Auriscalpium vulgare]